MQVHRAATVVAVRLGLGDYLSKTRRTSKQGVGRPPCASCLPQGLLPATLIPKGRASTIYTTSGRMWLPADVAFQAMDDRSFLEQDRHHHQQLRRREARRMSRQGVGCPCKLLATRPTADDLDTQRKGLADLYNDRQMRRTADVALDDVVVLLLVLAMDDHYFLKQDRHHYQQLHRREIRPAKQHVDGDHNVCSPRMLSLPRHTKVIVTCNYQTQVCLGRPTVCCQEGCWSWRLSLAGQQGRSGAGSGREGALAVASSVTPLFWLWRCCCCDGRGLLRLVRVCVHGRPLASTTSALAAVGWRQAMAFLCLRGLGCIVQQGGVASSRVVLPVTRRRRDAVLVAAIIFVDWMAYWSLW